MDAQQEVLSLLQLYGTPTPHRNHQAWRINSHLITLTETTSCWRSKLGAIRRALGMSGAQFYSSRCNGKAQ